MKDNLLVTKQDIQNELQVSMKAADSEKTSVLRMLLSALHYYEIQKGGAGYQASDEDVLTVLQKEVKQHKDSIEQFTNAGRNDLSQKETRELKILELYLPKQMSEEEIQTHVKEAIEQTNATSLQDIGKVMGVLMSKVKGKADGTIVRRLVSEALER